MKSILSKKTLILATCLFSAAQAEPKNDVTFESINDGNPSKIEIDIELLMFLDSKQRAAETPKRLADFLQRVEDCELTGKFTKIQEIDLKTNKLLGTKHINYVNVVGQDDKQSRIVYEKKEQQGNEPDYMPGHSIGVTRYNLFCPNNKKVKIFETLYPANVDRTIDAAKAEKRRKALSIIRVKDSLPMPRECEVKEENYTYGKVDVTVEFKYVCDDFDRTKYVHKWSSKDE